MSGARWQALVLAAGRGPDDPMAKAYGARNKCLIEIGGIAMIDRVLAALRATDAISGVTVSIEDEGLLDGRARFAPSRRSAAGSALHAIGSGRVSPPVLITTGDHPLLMPEMVNWFLGAADRSGADLAVGLATAETVLAAYPEARRTFLNFGSDRVSGCNLFAIRTERALKALEVWQRLDQLRKTPWRLVAAFGLGPLAKFALGRLTLASAFAEASRKLGLAAAPVLLPFAEAAIDVDKPADKDLAERILARR